MVFPASAMRSVRQCDARLVAGSAPDTGGFPMRGSKFVMVALLGVIVGLGMIGGGIFGEHANMVFADDGGKKPENEAPAEVQELRKECMALYAGILGYDDEEAGFKSSLWRLQDKGGVSNDEAKLIADMLDKHKKAQICLLGVEHLIWNEAAMENPTNVEKVKGDLAAIKADADKLSKDRHDLLMKHFPASDTVEPLRMEYRKACRWRPRGWGRDVEEELRTMYAFADTGTAYTDDEKSELDDLGVRYYHGITLEAELYKLLDDDYELTKLTNIAKAKRLLAEFKKITTGWDDTRHRLWHKVFDMASIAAHEKRNQDAAKALNDAEEKSEAPPK
ncbi:MAG: hypothetical protein HYW56_02360 [Candidatus Harrisonbacteria bacterium]|nr:hypothetical protein [Candidatus Harrisonbacteria bacterium]